MVKTHLNLSIPLALAEDSSLPDFWQNKHNFQSVKQCLLRLGGKTATGSTSSFILNDSGQKHARSNGYLKESWKDHHQKAKGMLRIDTSGWGVNFDALFDKVWRSCSLRDYYILYIIRLSILSIDMINDKIGQQMTVGTCHK